MRNRAAGIHASGHESGGRAPLSGSISRIAFLGSRGIPARYGGFETFVDEVARRLVRRGIEVTVFCERGDGPRPTEVEGVRLEYVPANAPGSLRTLLYDLSCLWRARRGHDVVYMLGYGAALFCFLPRLFGSRVWINMDGIEWKRSKWSSLARLWLYLMEGLAFLTADRLIFDNGALRDSILERRRKRVDTSVIEYGGPDVALDPDPSPLAEFDVTPGEYYLVVCRCEPENHVLEVCRAWLAAELDRPLLVVANTEPGTEYARRCTELASDGLRFVGTVYDQRVLVALRSHCRAYLHGHSVGGTNPSLLEAMACGNAVIAHDNVFNREVLGSCGRFFQTEADLASELQAFDRLSAGDVAELGRDARARIRESYTWSRITDRYQELLTGEPSPAHEAHRTQAAA